MEPREPVQSWPENGWPARRELELAQATVAATLPATPLVPLWLPDEAAGPIYMKLETLQPTGSFKVRGALAATAAYADVPGGIVTASAGNHGLGIAWAASRLGVQATIVVPETASAAKIEALRAFPSTLITYGTDYGAAEQHALHLARDAGRYVSAYNDPYVIAGQSSMLVEILEQISEPFTVVAPVGGGGLISGLALAAYASAREIKVVGVEAAASRAVSTAVRQGHIVPVSVAATIADGLAGNLDQYAVTPEIIRFTKTQMEVAEEHSLRRAMRMLATNAGIYAEGSAAAGLAAVMDGAVPADRPAVIAVTGRNITPQSFADAISSHDQCP
jgi:threonine dehydratase